MGCDCVIQSIIIYWSGDNKGFFVVYNAGVHGKYPVMHTAVPLVLIAALSSHFQHGRGDFSNSMCCVSDSIGASVGVWNHSFVEMPLLAILYQNVECWVFNFDFLNFSFQRNLGRWEVVLPFPFPPDPFPPLHPYSIFFPIPPLSLLPILTSFSSLYGLCLFLSSLLSFLSSCISLFYPLFSYLLPPSFLTTVMHMILHTLQN